MVLSDRIPVVHGIGRRHLIHSHRRHLQESCHLVHHAQRCEAGLALSEVEQRHDGGLLVLGWVAGEDLFDYGLVLRAELEGDGGVVLGGVAVLQE